MQLLQRMSGSLGHDCCYVAKLATSAPKSYREFAVPKANGSFRQIASPLPKIDRIQRHLLINELSELPVHYCATAYRTGSSIRDNAQRHAKNEFILKMDFKEFFNSIEPKHFRRHVRTHFPKKYTRQEMAILWRYLFWAQPTGDREKPYRLCLSVGSASSPFISNSIMYAADEHLAAFCSSRKITYTRYADDLTFSAGTMEQLRPLVSKVRQLNELPNLDFLTVNDKKTLFLTKAGNRTITGLVVTNEGRVSLGRDRKRLIRSMIDKFAKDQMPDMEDRVRLRGLLSFANDVEPDFVDRMKQKYGKDLFKTFSRSIRWT